MFIKNKTKILTLTIVILTLLFLTGCIGTSTDETQITQIAKNIEKAIKDKDADLFMENISYNYSDDDGGTYDNHINNLPEDLISKVELVEELLDPIPFLKVVTDVTLSNLIITDPYATGKMKITISLKLCVIGCISYPGTDKENIKYNIDFQKEDDEWKIVFLNEN